MQDKKLPYVRGFSELLILQSTDRTGLNCNYRALIARLPLNCSFIHLYFLGDRAGQHEILTDSLPGLPDNIKARNKCYKLS
jgi:hypothetical protein